MHPRNWKVRDAQSKLFNWHNWHNTQSKLFNWQNWFWTKAVCRLAEYNSPNIKGQGIGWICLLRGFTLRHDCDLTWNSSSVNDYSAFVTIHTISNTLLITQFSSLANPSVSFIRPPHLATPCYTAKSQTHMAGFSYTVKLQKPLTRLHSLQGPDTLKSHTLLWGSWRIVKPHTLLAESRGPETTHPWQDLDTLWIPYTPGWVLIHWNPYIPGRVWTLKPIHTRRVLTNVKPHTCLTGTDTLWNPLLAWRYPDLHEIPHNSKANPSSCNLY